MLTPVSKSNTVKMLKKKSREKNWTWDGLCCGYPDSDREDDDYDKSSENHKVTLPDNAIGMTDEERQLLRD